MRAMERMSNLVTCCGLPCLLVLVVGGGLSCKSGVDDAPAAPESPTEAATEAVTPALLAADVEVTGEIVPGGQDFDALALMNRVQVGETPGEVVEHLGLPKEKKHEEGVWRWFYTYEFPEETGNDRWMILMVEFKEEKVALCFWLPAG